MAKDTINPTATGADDSDVEAVAWADIENMDVTGATVKLTVVTEAKGADVAAMYFNEGYSSAVTAAKYGVVLEDPWLTSDGWKVSVDVYGEGEKEYLLATGTDEDDLAEGYVIEFTVNPDGELVLEDVEVADKVEGVSGRYVDFGAGWVRIADDAVLYQLDEDGYIDAEMSYTDIEVGDILRYAVDATSGRIVAAAREVPKAQYDLTISKEGQGTVDPPVGTHTYDEGEVVNLTASPATGWTFSKWEGPVADTSDPTTTVTMDADKSVKAVFVPVANYAFSLDKWLYARGDDVVVRLTNNTQTVLRVGEGWTVAWSAEEAQGGTAEGEYTFGAGEAVTIYPAHTKDLVQISGLTGTDGEWTMAVALFDAEDKLVAQGTVAFEVDATAPAAHGTTPITVTDSDSNGYDEGDKITIKFSEPVLASKITVENTQLPDGKSLGSGAAWAAVGAVGGYADTFEVTLGTGANVAAGDTLTFAAANVVDKAGNQAAANVVFTLP